VPLVILGALTATGRLHRRRKAPAPAPDGQPPAADGKPPKREGWEQRLVSKPRFGIAVLLGAVAGTPGADYVIALHQLVTGQSATGAQAVAVVVFALIEFSLVIIPFVFLLVRPAATETQLLHAQHWLKSHARQVLATVALLVGAFMVVSGLIRLT
jgi:hypothetical protein